MSMSDYMLRVCEHIVLPTVCEKSPMYSLGAVGDKDELIRFWGEMVVDQVMTRPNMVRNHLFENRPSWQSHTGRCFTIEDHLVTVVVLMKIH